MLPVNCGGTVVVNQTAKQMSELSDCAPIVDVILKHIQKGGILALLVGTGCWCWCQPLPLLRDVKQAEPPSPGGPSLASPSEALGCLQAATAALPGFTFILARYGDPVSRKIRIQ